MSILAHEFLTETATRVPDDVALVVDGHAHTFGEIDRTSDRLARSMQDAGLERGDRVVIFGENRVEVVVSIFGVLKAGGVFVVLNPTTKADKLAFCVNDCAAKLLVASARLAAPLGEALAQAPSVGATIWFGEPGSGSEPGIRFADIIEDRGAGPRDPRLIDEDLAAIIYTSGSTGDAKGVMLTHRNMCHNTWSISTYLGLRADDVVACVLPLSFDYGLFQVLMGARVGCRILLERSFAYPFDVVSRLAEYRVTVFPGVPTVFATMLSMPALADLDLSSVRVVTNTAAALVPAHIGRLREWLRDARIFSMYGLTECTRVSYLDPDRLDDKITSVGKAIPNTEVYVVGADGQRVGPGVVGELVVRGASVMRGYWNRPAETARYLRDGEIAGEKVLHTGDEFCTDDEGFLYFVGRTDDVFKCRGEKVSPVEVERVLCEIPEVAQAAVVGVPDEIDGTAVKAVVAPVADGSLDGTRITRHCRARLESHLVPKFVEIRPALPETAHGKIDKAKLA